MFYRNIRLKKNIVNYKINYSSFAGGMNTDVDENLMPHKYGTMCYNYIAKDGSLKTGYGFNNIRLPKSRQNPETRFILLPNNVKFKGIWHYKYYSSVNKRREDMLVFYGDSKSIYWCKLISIDPNTFFIDSLLTYKQIPNVISYRQNNSDVLICTSPEDDMIVFAPERELQTINNAPKIVSMCLHYERLFAIVEGERIELRFSDDLDITNWTSSPSEGGYIQLLDERGPMSKVLSFLDYVYIIRDFGITRLSAFGDQDDFSISHAYLTSDKIYGNSAVVCGNKILFLARNGIYMFDGVSAKKITSNIDKLFEGVFNENACAAYFNNKYYLSCKLNFNDKEDIGCENYEGGYINNAIIEFDLTTGDFNIMRGVDIISMVSVEESVVSKLIVCFGGEHATKLGELTNDGCLFSQPLKKVWRSPMSNLGYPGKVKIIKEVYVQSKYDCIVKIKTEKDEKSYTVKASNKCTILKPKLTGEKLQISFITEGDFSEISCPQVLVGVIS